MTKGSSSGSALLNTTRPAVVSMIRSSTSSTRVLSTSWSSREAVRSISSPLRRSRTGLSVSISPAARASSTSSTEPKTRPWRTRMAVGALISPFLNAFSTSSAEPKTRPSPGLGALALVT